MVWQALIVTAGAIALALIEKGGKKKSAHRGRARKAKK